MVIDAVSGGGVGMLGIGLSFGLAVMAAIYAVGHISGAHITPAVTIAFALTRHFPWTQVPAYVIAQLSGAAAASATLLMLFGDVADLGATVPSGSPLQALGLELILTLFLMFVVAAVATDVRHRRSRRGSGRGHSHRWLRRPRVHLRRTRGRASMNPARSFGPALLSGTWIYHWVYWVGPLSGVIVGAFLYRYVRAAHPPEPVGGAKGSP